MKIFYKTIFTAIFLQVCSCNLHNPYVSKDMAIQSQAKKNLKITINNLNFKSKANPEMNSRVKSFEGFLTSNYNDPFASGANPYGPNVKFHADVINGTANIVFPNVPAHGPYYAVIAAFDKLNIATDKINITRADQTITSTDKKWARSSNSFTNNSVLTFSDNSNALKVTLKLIPFVTINTDIIITNGSTMPDTIGLTN